MRHGWEIKQKTEKEKREEKKEGVEKLNPTNERSPGAKAALRVIVESHSCITFEATLPGAFSAGFARVGWSSLVRRRAQSVRV